MISGKEITTNMSIDIVTPQGESLRPHGEAAVVVKTDYFTDRSRTQLYQRCHRARWWENEYQRRGIVPKRLSLHLIVGSAFHAGAAYLLREAGMQQDTGADLEDRAVNAALREFDSLSTDGIESDFESEAMALATLGVTTTDTVPESAFQPVHQAESAFPTGLEGAQSYLRAEMRALTEALVRVFARRGLSRLLEQYIVLEVEREGKWLMAEDATIRLWWMSRLDALLVDRVTNQLVIQSFKTAGDLDVRRLRDAERDMQGLSEVPDIEMRLGQWWQELHQADRKSVRSFDIACMFVNHELIMRDYLQAQHSAPRVDAIRYEYLLKGRRDKNANLSARMGCQMRVQNTPLLRAWFPKGQLLTASDAAGQIKHSFAWTNELGESKRLYAKNYEQKPVWEVMPIREWIDMLDSGRVQPEAREPGTLDKPQDVLGESLATPVIVYRQDDEFRDWYEQVEAQERAVVYAAQTVHEQAGDPARQRSLLNVLFPQNRNACSYPGDCSFARICYGSEQMRADPLGSGHYRVRTPNHPVEGER